MRTIGEAIRKIRDEKGILQKEIARLTDISQTSLSLIENTQSRPSVKNLNKIAKALRVPVWMIYVEIIECHVDLPENKQQIFKQLITLLKK